MNEVHGTFEGIVNHDPHEQGATGHAADRVGASVSGDVMPQCVGHEVPETVAEPSAPGALTRVRGAVSGMAGNRTGFTLLEVLIAMALFFMAIFALLQLTSRNLQMARFIQQTPQIDISSIASELSLTNELEEGVESGDFGDIHPGYSWSRQVLEVSSNGLFQVDFTITWQKTRASQQYTTSILLFRPDSGQSPTGARGRRRR